MRQIWIEKKNANKKSRLNFIHLQNSYKGV